MTKLKSVYPLYPNNAAQQPNTDLAVTDKFTGEVAFRVARADVATIDTAIAGAVEAAEPMARMAVRPFQHGWFKDPRELFSLWED